jgi:hypothetical protein
MLTTQTLFTLMRQYEIGFIEGLVDKTTGRTRWKAND